ncbi:Diguanylate cyclase (GGDEF)-like protein/PAS domain S-box-containing protein OS=Castellaniella defragrans OX=75697 GN=HNR28_000027 PE=4 SV=1 [Castellaniella defragrans]
MRASPSDERDTGSQAATDTRAACLFAAGKNGEAMLSALIVALIALLIAILYFRHRERTHQNRLDWAENRLNTILDTTEEIVHIKDREGRYLYANHKTCEFFGLPSSALIMHSNRELLDDENVVALIERDEQQVLQFGQRVMTQKRIFSPALGKELTYLTVKAPLRNAAGQIEAVCTLMTDVTERMEAEERAHKLTFYDTLTDLPNAHFLMQRLTQTVQTARSDGENGALLVLDLDDFKKINDTQGFENGNQVLREVAQRLINGTHARDTVSRINADVFAILLTQLGSRIDESARQATELTRAVVYALTSSPLPLGQRPYALKASVGVTLLHAGTASADDALREADIAMHQAKERGGGQMVFYEQALQRKIEQRLWLEQDLAHAVGTSQLQMYVQPQYAADGRLAGAELLARWNHPTRGMLLPDTFIPLAEKTGLLRAITDWAIEEACGLLNACAARGQAPLISVNISPGCLMEPGFPAHIRNALERSGAPSHLLIMEVTEGAWLEDYDEAAARMAEIRELGVRFSVDDFGTGYSNLAYLKRLPLFEMKIDKSLVQDLPHDQDAAAIVRMALTMARQLGLRTVAEGVETEPQADFLREERCDALQGFLLARPMPIPAWLAQIG